MMTVIARILRYYSGVEIIIDCIRWTTITRQDRHKSYHKYPYFVHRKIIHYEKLCIKGSTGKYNECNKRKSVYNFERCL